MYLFFSINELINFQHQSSYPFIHLILFISFCKIIFDPINNKPASIILDSKKEKMILKENKHVTDQFLVKKGDCKDPGK